MLLGVTIFMGADTALREPTPKQKLWYMHYINDSNRTTFLNGTQSALASYDTTDSNTANQIALDNKKFFKKVLDKWFDEEMFSEQALKDKVRSLMSAGETKFMKVKGAVKKEDLKPGQRIVCTSGSTLKGEDEEGKEIETFVAEETLIAIDRDAKEIQRRSTDMALKIKGSYAADKLEVMGLEGLGERLAGAKKRAAGEGGEDVNDDLFS